MVEKKNLRKTLREMKIGQTIIVLREDYLPSSVKSQVYTVQTDMGVRFTVNTKIPNGVEVRRIA